jgi:hypothetical protein
MPTTEQTRTWGERRRERLAAQSRAETASVSSIEHPDNGPLPKVQNPRRKRACRLDLKRFLQTYFPNSTGLSPFSADHERVIERIRLCEAEGGRFVNAVYRGFAKTSIAEGTALHAALYGHRKCVPVFGADADAAKGIIESIKLELSENDLLYADFPEVCHAVRHLAGRPQRALSQHFRGAATHIRWTSDEIVLPTIRGSKASGAIICARGITGGFRGLKFKMADGTQQRPDFIIGDDLQTDESASSPMQVQKMLSTLRKGVAKLGGHRKALAIIINATIIQPDDVIDLLLRDAAWQGERVPLVRAWPEAHKTLWLENYATLRRTYDKDRPGDQARAHGEATAFYRQHREAMEAGAVVSWQSCFDPATEVSALQHAYNALIDDGEEAFMSEYQVNPLPREKPAAGELAKANILARLNHHARGLVPSWASRLTAFVDVQHSVLFWCVCGFGDGFTGCVVDYGGWPDQKRAYFSKADIRPTLEAFTGIGSLEGAVFAGLTGLAKHLLDREWQVDGGSLLRVERCLVDSGEGALTHLVRKFCRESAHAGILRASKGWFGGSAARQISEWTIRPGERKGLEWIERIPERGKGRQVIYGTNVWKTFVSHRLRQPLGEPGALTLFGDEADAHQLLADHLTAEFPVEVENKATKKVMQVWTRRPNRDNDLLDCLCGAFVAASMLGCALAEMRPASRPKSAKKTMQQLQAERRGGR